MLVAAVVFDAAVEAMGFGGVETVLFVKANGGSIEDVRLPGKDTGFHFGRIGDGGEKSFVGIFGGEFLRVGGAFDLRGLLFFFGDSFDDGRCENGEKGAEREGNAGIENHELESRSVDEWDLFDRPDGAAFDKFSFGESLTLVNFSLGEIAGPALDPSGDGTVIPLDE